MLEGIIANRDIIKLIYGILIVLICMIIVARAHRIFKISLHQGIRYFRNAFLFYGIAFFIRYVFGHFHDYGNWIYLTSNVLFEFFIIMAGFFLLYSLMWKRIDAGKENQLSSLFNKKLIVFYIMTLIILALDNLWDTYAFMFISQIILFFSLSIISYLNYQKKGHERKFLKFYFIAMLLSLFAWILNAVAAVYFNWNLSMLITVPIINLIIFLLFLFGVIRLTKKT